MPVSRILARRLPLRSPYFTIRLGRRCFCQESSGEDESLDSAEHESKQTKFGADAYDPLFPRGNELQYTKRFNEKPFGINVNKAEKSALWVTSSAWRDIVPMARFAYVEELKIKRVKDKDQIEVGERKVLANPDDLEILKKIRTPCQITFYMPVENQEAVDEAKAEADDDDLFWSSLDKVEQYNTKTEEVEQKQDRLWWKVGAEKPWVNTSRDSEPLIPMEQEKAELTRFLTTLELEEHIDRFHSMTQLVLCKTEDLTLLEIPIQHRRKILKGKKHWLQYQNIMKYGPLPYMNADGTRSYMPNASQQMNAEIEYQPQKDMTADKPAPKHMQFVWFPPKFPDLDWYPDEYKPDWVTPIAPASKSKYRK